MASFVSVDSEQRARGRKRLVLVAASAAATFVGGFAGIAVAAWLAYTLGHGSGHFSPAMALGSFAIGGLLGSTLVRRALDRTEPAPPASPELRDATLAVLKQPAVANQNAKFWPMLVISLFAFVATGGVTRGVQSLLLITAILAFHEAGHLLAMRIFGYRDTRILFIPLLGAVTSGKRENVPGNQRAIVLLAGPLPGLLLGIALLFAGGHDPQMRHASALFVAINGFNLLPLGALDGGKLLDVLVFSRNPWFHAAFTLLSAALLGLLALGLHSWLLFAVGLFSMVSATRQYAIAAAARALGTHAAFPLELDSASPEFLEALFAAAYDTLPSYSKQPHRAQSLPALCADVMRSIHSQAAQRPASLGVTVPILIGYAVLFALGTLGWIHRADHHATPSSVRSQSPD